MSQPLWYLRHQDRIIGPYPSPQVKEFLRLEEISPDWEVSLDTVDWISIRDSGQFEDRSPPRSPPGPGPSSDVSGTDGETTPIRWGDEREQARHRWLQNGQEIAQAESHDLARERRTRQALALDEARTETLLQAERNHRPPLLGVLLALLVVLCAAYFIEWGQEDQSAIQAGIAFKADCSRGLGEAVNWQGCDKHGVAAPGGQGRNMRMDNANLADANLAGADLSYGTFVRAKLRNANLRGATLTGVDLTGADLSGADLRNAVLAYAVLAGARLEGARLDGARLGKATWVDGRTCPESALGACE